MSLKDLKRLYQPDTPEEWSQIGSAINRLGIVMSGIGAFQHNNTWVLISLGSTWLGHELSEYFKIYTKNRIEEKKDGKDKADDNPNP